MQAEQIILTKNAYLYQPMDKAKIDTAYSIEKRYEHVFQLHYEELAGYANTFTKNQADAEDIVQSVFVELWKDRSKIEMQNDIRAYLYRGIHFKCLNHIKHQKVIHKHNLTLVHKAPSHHTDSLVSKELEAKITATLEQLPEQCKKIFSMNRFEHKKYREIAEELSLSPKTVENQIAKALKIFRVALSDFLYFFFITLNFLS